MAMKIVEECINCGACEPVCPTEAIHISAMGRRASKVSSQIGQRYS